MRVCPQCGEKYPGGEIFCPRDGARVTDPSGTSDIVHRRSVPPKKEEHDSLIGSMVQNRYRIIRRLGEGGMGVVYEALHVEIEKKMAIKVLRDDFSAKPEVVERFRQEARSASRVGNPHIVDVTDFGQLPDGGVFFAMEMLEGVALDELVTGQSISLERAVPLIDQIARALQAAHDKGIVHRDLKPENIIIVQREEEGDFVKILDFGIAKISDQDTEGKRLTQTGMIFGTPEYMSPEQASGKSLDHRVDVYALGCIMFEMFTGQVPYTGDSFMAILTQHMFEPIPDILEINPACDVPPSVLNVVYKAMSKDADTRYANMYALREDLHRALADANFVVDYPGRDQSASIVLGNLAGGTNRNATRRANPISMAYMQKRPQFMKVIVGLMLLIVGLVGLLMYTWRDNEPDESTTAGIQQPKVEPLPQIDESPVPPPPQETDTREEASAPSRINASFLTVPEGAVIHIAGMGQVCSSAPCQVEVEMGAPIEVSARVGEFTRTEVFTPSAQNRELTLIIKTEEILDTSESETDEDTGEVSTEKKKNLKKKRRRIPGRKTGRTSKTNATGGLKIPDVFKNN